MDLVANLPLSLTVKEFLKSVNICQSYDQIGLYNGTFVMAHGVHRPIGYICCRFLCARPQLEVAMEWYGRWIVCLLLCILPMTCRCRGLALPSDGAKQRDKRLTAINEETPWSYDDGDQVQVWISHRSILSEQTYYAAQACLRYTFQRFPFPLHF